MRGPPRAGVRPGDVIYKLDTQSVASVEDIRRYLERLADGTKVHISLVRMTPSGVQRVDETLTAQVPRQAR